MTDRQSPSPQSGQPPLHKGAFCVVIPSEHSERGNLLPYRFEIAASLRSFAFAKCTQRNDEDIVAMTYRFVIPSEHSERGNLLPYRFEIATAFCKRFAMT